MYRFRRDKDCVAWFAEELKVLAHNVKSILSANIPMEFTRDDLENLIALRTVTYAKNRSRQTTREYAIIAI